MVNGSPTISSRADGGQGPLSSSGAPKDSGNRRLSAAAATVAMSVLDSLLLRLRFNCKRMRTLAAKSRGLTKVTSAFFQYGVQYCVFLAHSTSFGAYTLYIEAVNPIRGAT